MKCESFFGWLQESSPTDYLGVIGLVLSGVFVAYRYWVSKRIERSMSGMEILRELEDNDWVLLCCQMLDWTARGFRLSPKIEQSLVPSITGEEDMDVTLFIHSSTRMAKALEVGREKYEPHEVLYRDTFDRFLTYLYRVDSALNSEIFAPKDIKPLGYYIDALFTRKHHDEKATQAILAYIKAYYNEEMLRALRNRIKSA